MTTIGTIRGVPYHGIVLLGEHDLEKAVKDACAPGTAEKGWGSPGATAKVALKGVNFAVVETRRPEQPAGLRIVRQLYISPVVAEGRDPVEPWEWKRVTQSFAFDLCCVQEGDDGDYTLAEWPMDEDYPSRVHVDTTPNPLSAPALLAGYETTGEQDAALMGIFIELSSWLWKMNRMHTDTEDECRRVFIEGVRQQGHREPYGAAWKAV